MPCDLHVHRSMVDLDRLQSLVGVAVVEAKKPESINTVPISLVAEPDDSARPSKT